jgi:cytochrome c556
MKIIVQYLSVIIFLIIVEISITNAQDQQAVKHKPKTSDVEASLPASLENLYPPKTQEAVFLVRMLGMAKPFTGIMVDLFENDLDNSKINFEKFKAQYIEVSKLVPDWEKDYPLEPVNDLGTVLKSGEKDKVMPALEQVGKICSNCHSKNMPRVQYKYHWGNFQEILIADPITKQEVNFQQFMLYIDASFTGIGVDVEQGQIENAKRQLYGFRERFEALEETCMNCHDTERHYYVDQGTITLIDKLDQALHTSPVDQKEIDKISQGIGVETCFKCHLVHVPAAISQLKSKK